MDYITISDVDKSGYYPLSKQLFNNKFYQKKVKKIKTINDKNGNSKKIEVIVIEEKLKDTTKILYSILCEQLNRSISNGWWDNRRRVFVKYSLEKLSMLLNKSKDTIKTCLKELEDNELLESVSDGIGKANLFYLGKIKEKTAEDIEMEYEDKVPLNKTFCKPVEDFDQSKVSAKPVESFDSKPVEDFDSINYILLTNNKKATANIDTINKKEPVPSDQQDSSSFLYEFLNNYKLDAGTKENIKKHIKGLTEERFKLIYMEIAKRFKEGKINDFSAGIFTALKNNWDNEWNIKAENKSIVDTEKERKKIKGDYEYWLDYYKACGGVPEIIAQRFESDVQNIRNKNLIAEYKKKLLKTMRKEE